MIILSLDPGIRIRGGTGIARVEFSSMGIVQGFATRLVGKLKSEHRTDTLKRVREAIRELAEGATHLIVEDQTRVAVGAQARGQWGAGNLGVLLVQGLAHGVGLDVIEVQPQAAKLAVGVGASASKEQVIRAVKARLGELAPDKLSEHEADAVAIAFAGRQEIRRRQHPLAMLGAISSVAKRSKSQPKLPTRSKLRNASNQKPRA